jgi:hypothetical protein
MNLNNIPKEIQALNQWVCSKEGSKAPMIASTNALASSTNPTTWCSFEQALSSVEAGNYDYIGYVFNDNGIVGVDIDDGYDEEGFLSPLASDIIGKCQSYTEKSKSGRGFHILLKGNLPFKGKNNRNGVEIYKTARYFIMTGDTLLYDKISDNQDAIDYIVNKYFPEMRESENKGIVPKIYTPIWEKPMIDGRIKLRPVYPLIPDGCRNICLTSLAGMLHNQGYNPQAIYEELTYCNTVACEPMLPDGEVITIVNSVTRYKR